MPVEERRFVGREWDPSYESRSGAVGLRRGVPRRLKPLLSCEFIARLKAVRFHGVPLVRLR